MSNRFGFLNMWTAHVVKSIDKHHHHGNANAREPLESDGLRPELSLALAVVCNAIVDIHRGSRRRFVRESAARYAERQQDGKDAEDFLLHRLNEEDNCWGRVLRQCGMRPLTKERVAHLVRNRAFLTLEQFAAA